MTQLYAEVFYPKQVRTLRCSPNFISFFNNGDRDHEIITKDNVRIGRLIGILNSIVIIESLELNTINKTELICEDCEVAFTECKWLVVA